MFQSSRRYYRRYYMLVAIAVVLMMAVLTGSLVLGDSVRGTLSDRVGQRLGRTHTVISSGSGFVSDEVMQWPVLSDADGYLLVDGFVSSEGRLLPVYVWGTDSDSIGYGDALVNESLLRTVGTDDIVLHLPAHSMVPSGSLFVTRSYSTQMRLHVTGTRHRDADLLLHNDQARPLNIFVRRDELSEMMELSHQLNVILSPRAISESQLNEYWSPRYSGICQSQGVLTSSRIFIQRDVVDMLHPAVRYFSYLVNDIVAGSDTVPYSFVTAVDQWDGRPLTGNTIILSDYAAARLHVSIGDSVSMSYFLARDLKNLQTAELRLQVAAIVPLSQFEADTLLRADFPGLSNVEKCTDWDSDLPIVMDRIQQVDEDYWYAHHQTPKAIVAYDAVIGHWANAFGTATALRLSENAPLASDVLRPRQFLTLASPRDAGLYAASHGTDFASLFLALGFFIILSAILLIQNPLVEMFAERRGEMQLYLQMGFTVRRVRIRLFREAFGVMFAASVVGLLAGVVYSGTTLWLLGNVWSGATHTEGFTLHVQSLTLLMSWMIGVVICALSLWHIVKPVGSIAVNDAHPASASRESVRGNDMPPARPSFCLPLSLLGVAVLLVMVNVLWLQSIVLFCLGGLCWIVAVGLLLRVWILSASLNSSSQLWSRGLQRWMVLRSSCRQQLIAFWSLALGVFTVFAVGLNRPDFSDFDSLGDGGYQVYVDCRVPLQYDLNSVDARKRLQLDGLPSATRFLPMLRHTEDEASCLNLNKVATPTVLGVEIHEMKQIGITDSKPFDLPSVYIDEEALIWSMMKSVGDTLAYCDGRGDTVKVLIAGSYPTGIFHGNAIMSADDFRRLWPDESGVEVFLMSSSDPEAAVALLEVALHEYGLRIQTIEERIRLFFEVTDTYLLIFLTLGAIGMLLGLLGLVVIVRKNLVAQRLRIGLYRSLGFTSSTVVGMLVGENVLVPFLAIVSGAVGSFISISANVAGAGWGSLMIALFTIAALLAVTYIGIRLIIKQIINKQYQQ